MQRISQSHARPSVVSVLLVSIVLALVGATLSWTGTSRTPSGLSLGRSLGADAIARRAEAGFADVGDEIARSVRGAKRAELVFYRGATSSACVIGTSGRGVFYCPESGVAAIDLGYLEALVARLQSRADLGVALVAARLGAEHWQREAGILDTAALDMIGSRKSRRESIRQALMLQADCLTGAWAAAAESRLGPVPDGFWSELIYMASNVSADFASAGRRIPDELDTFAGGLRAERARAFEAGRAAGRPAACPTPVRLD